MKNNSMHNYENVFPAAEAGDLGRVKELAAQGKVNFAIEHEEGLHLIELAVISGNVELVSFLDTLYVKQRGATVTKGKPWLTEDCIHYAIRSRKCRMLEYICTKLNNYSNFSNSNLLPAVIHADFEMIIFILPRLSKVKLNSSEFKPEDLIRWAKVYCNKAKSENANEQEIERRKTILNSLEENFAKRGALATATRAQPKVR